MDFTQSMTSVLKKYVTFTGRASRSEFWNWYLFCLVISALASLIDTTVLHVTDPNALHPISTIFSLLVFLPSLAVSVRRLHDVDRSGWWLLIGVTIIGLFFPLLYWYCRKPTPGNNRFGSEAV